MHMAQAFTSNGIAALLLLSLMISFKRKFRGGDKDIKVFFGMLVVNLFQCIVEPITVIIDGKMFPGAIPLATVLNSFLFIGNIIFATLWSVYAGLRVRMYKHKEITRFARFYVYIPMVIVILGAIINWFTPVYFSINENNVYERAAFFILPYIASYIYLLAGTAVAYGFAQRMDRYVFLPAFTFMFPVVIASVAQYMMPPGYSLIWAGTAIGMMSAYVTLLDESSSIDPLTGTFTRHYFNQYLRTLHSRSRGNKMVVGVMIDVDGFKNINDSYGHTAGDDALRQFGKILRKTCHNVGAMVFRFGGDEFAIIAMVDNEEEVASIIEEMNSRVDAINQNTDNPYLLEASTGYTIYRHGEKPTDFVKRMDESMYLNKSERKKKSI